ncbi:MAG TPA: phenylalanine--tRNA ligase subunit beta [Bryobacteraceae bacterium]|nr:phenylalanine--tRNA ligase subunit beta [Bryobacteraceae bacterium]
MKLSYQWLAELAPGLDIEPERLERLITMKTAECDGIEAYGAHFASVVAAKLVALEILPKSKNQLAVVDVGGGLHKRVVCGASNVRVGMLTAWVPPGTMLGSKMIGLALIDGVESEGMLASGAELGINRDHSGVLELSNIEPGQPLPRLKPDWIIEIDNKSLTHRPDLWGHYGMAREVAAITGRSLVDPVQMDVLTPAAPIIKVEIADYALCPRYSALLVERVRVEPSPLWLQARLESVGMNAISNIVDITNYVLAELPQPMHAFDADKLHGGTIFVRLAERGETLKALNGETYTLAAEDLVIADAAGPVALAGVIGGADTAISETTTRIVLESANFLAGSVRLTSARHRLRTDASMRFEKSLDPENTVRGLARAAALLQQIVPEARLHGGISDCRATRAAQTPPVALPVSFVVQKLGKNVTQQQIVSILTALQFGMSELSPGLLNVSIPAWRATKDISLKDDLVEEIGRMIGYGEITPAAPLIASVVPPANPLREYLRHVRFQLAAQGFTEVYNYSFLDESDFERFETSATDFLEVRNPIAAGQTHLRNSLLPGLFRNVVSNARHFEDFRLFEIGDEIHPAGTDLPREIPHAAGVLYSVHATEEDFFEMKRVVEAVLPGARAHAASAGVYEHPARVAEISWQSSAVGRVAEFHPSLLQEAGLIGRAFFFDIDLNETLRLAQAHTVQYKPLRKYPTSGFDLSIVAGLRTPVADIEDQLRRLGGDQIATIYFVRQYTGRPLAEGQKSVSYHLEVGSLDHTLTAEEAGEIRNRMIEGMRALGYELRV